MKQDNSIISKSKTAYQRDGMKYVIRTGLNLALHYPIESFLLWFYKRFETQEFIFQGKSYKYFYSRKGKTWETERAVEIPIACDFLSKYNECKGNILEVGNVLSSRFDISYDVVDKYEVRKGVINQDVVDFLPNNKRYDLILSISTLEHVGWDEKPREPDKILRAIRNLENLLSIKGELVVTLPLGQNPHLDSLLKRGILRFKHQYFMKRVAKSNRWEETKREEVNNIEYDWTIPAANAILIGVTESS